MSERQAQYKTRKTQQSRRRNGDGESFEHATVSRVPPHSTEAEMGLLGSVMISGSSVIDDVLSVVAEDDDFFYQHAHRVIWKHLADLRSCNEAIDPVTLQQRLHDMGELDEVGGPVYVANLFTTVPTAGNWRHYLDICAEKRTLRRLIEVGTRMVANAFDTHGEDVAALVDQAEKDVLAIRTQTASDEPKTYRDTVPKVVETIECLFHNKGRIRGVATGFRDLDQLTGGLHAGEVVVLAARPGVGKTAFAMCVLEHVCVDEGLPVGVFTLEMTAESLTLRSLCSMARLDSHRVNKGVLSSSDFPPLTTAAAKLIQAKAFFDDSSYLTALTLRSRARRMKAKHDIKLLVVDYLQLVSDPSARERGNREAEVASVSRQMKSLSKELGIPVLLLAQLNRDIEGRGKNPEPKLSDLRESGATEQDADCVAFLTRKEDEDQPGTLGPEATLWVKKQRNGPTGPVKLHFEGKWTRFFDAARASESVDAPY